MKIPSPVARRRPRIEIIPLIDVIFFLLATFVMVSLSMTKDQGMNVDLPTAATSARLALQPTVTITLTANGSLYYNKESIALADLPPLLQALKAQSADPTVYLNGDAKALFGQSIAVLDDLRKEQITRISIQTRPVSGTP
jgi:biopolymer transport protein ExbD